MLPCLARYAHYLYAHVTTTSPSVPHPRHVTATDVRTDRGRRQRPPRPRHLSPSAANITRWMGHVGVGPRRAADIRRHSQLAPRGPSLADG